MKSMKKVLASLAVLVSVSSMAFADDMSKKIEKGLQDGPVKEILDFPAGKFRAVKADKDSIYFVSDSGRFLIKGDVYDMLHGKRLDKWEDIRTYFGKIDLKEMGVKFSELNEMVVGNGTEDVTIFVDPFCPHCHTIISKLEQQDKKYKFHIIPLPILSEKSFSAVKALTCEKDNKKALQRFNTGNYEGLNPDGCDMGSLQKSMTIARLAGLEAVPFIVNSHGRSVRGAPVDFKGFLESK